MTQPNFSADRLRSVLSSVLNVATEIEKIVAVSGIAGGFNAPQVEQLTLLFGNLATAAIQAAHDALGKEITPGSVLELMPAATPLVSPSA